MSAVPATTEAPQAIRVINDLPHSPIEVVPAALVEVHQKLLSSAKLIPATIANAEQHVEAERVITEMARVKKMVEDAADPLVRYAHRTHKALLEARNNAVNPMETAMVKLRMAIGGWNRKAEEERKAALAKAEAERKAAEERAEAERIRLQKEADAKHAAEVAAAEAKRKADQDAADAAAAAETKRRQEEQDKEDAELAEFLGKTVEEVRAERAPVQAVAAEKIEAPVIAPAPVVKVEVATPAIIVPEAVKSAVTERTNTVLDITDERSVPTYIGGVCVRPIDKVALKKLLKEGVVVLGARLKEETIDVLKAGR
jgi:hypothetical protein